MGRVGARIVRPAGWRPVLQLARYPAVGATTANDRLLGSRRSSLANASLDQCSLSRVLFPIPNLADTLRRLRWRERRDDRTGSRAGCRHGYRAIKLNRPPSGETSSAK